MSCSGPLAATLLLCFAATTIMADLHALSSKDSPAPRPGKAFPALHDKLHAVSHVHRHEHSASTARQISLIKQLHEARGAAVHLRSDVDERTPAGKYRYANLTPLRTAAANLTDEILRTATGTATQQTGTVSRAVLMQQQLTSAHAIALELQQLVHSNRMYDELGAKQAGPKLSSKAMAQLQERVSKAVELTAGVVSLLNQSGSEAETRILLEEGADLPHIAICIVGDARGFVHEPVWRSILEHAIGAVGGVSHIYFYLKHTSIDEAAAINATLRRLEESLPPRAWIATARLVPKQDASVPLNAACPPKGGHRLKFSVMAHDQEVCFSLVKEGERSLPQRTGYSLVVKLRPDELICKPFPPWTEFVYRPDFHRAVKTFAYHPFEYQMLRLGHMINDHVAIMARPVADRYFSAKQEVDSPDACMRNRSHYNTSVCSPIGTSGSKTASLRNYPNDVWVECYLSKWLADANIAYKEVLGPRDTCIFRYAGMGKETEARLFRTISADVRDLPKALVPPCEKDCTCCPHHHGMAASA